MVIRGWGVQKTPEERVASHYGINIYEARRWLAIHPESELLPARGAGLTRGTAAGIGNEIDTGVILQGGLFAAGVLAIIAVSVFGKR